MNNARFLVVSYSKPERASGTPVVIRKFLENFSGDEVVLIGRPVLENERVRGIKFHYPVITIPTPPVGFRGERIWRLLSTVVGLYVGLMALRRQNAKAILAFYRDESSLLTGYLLHKITNLPFFAYFCDLYLENYQTGYQGLLARWLQPRVFQSATKVLVLTESIKDYYLEEYGIDAEVLPHCNNLPQINPIPTPGVGSKFRIGYLGTVNEDRASSLRMLCEHLRGKDQYHLSYFSPTPPDYLSQLGLLIDNSDVKFIPTDDLLLKELCTCDLLFLPLSAPKDDVRELQMLTGFPTKAIEYLLCRKPILVHTCMHYFAAQFFTNYECGYVIDGDPDEIGQAIENIAHDDDLKKRLTENTQKAISYFDGKRIADNFRKLANFS